MTDERPETVKEETHHDSKTASTQRASTSAAEEDMDQLGEVNSSKESLDDTRKRPKRVHPASCSPIIQLLEIASDNKSSILMHSGSPPIFSGSRLPSPTASPHPSPVIKPLEFSPVTHSQHGRDRQSSIQILQLVPGCTSGDSFERNAGSKVESTAKDHQNRDSAFVQKGPGHVTFWDYLRSELVTVDYDDSHDIKNERVHNFLHVPLELEKFIWFGFLICVDSFLFVFTFLQIRLFMAMMGVIRYILSGGSRRLKAAEKVDLMKGFLFYTTCYMMHSMDASMIYHSVRGQAVIKLYVIFNVLEVCDKLCSAFGHDILDSLFSKTATSQFSSPSSLRRLGHMSHLVVALVYVYIHTVILFYQVMTLNVAVNSFSNSLLTLMMSNQFVEIKGSVFKKFEKENVFQLSCSDIVERFQLVLFMALITIRNYLELTGGGNVSQVYSSLYAFTTGLSFNATEASLEWSQAVTLYTSRIYSNLLSLWSAFTISPLETLPSVFNQILSAVDEATSSPTFGFFITLLTPFVVVIGTEVIVDGLKHAFITKFNQIRPEAYHQYMATVCRDLAGIRKKPNKGAASVPFSDRSYTVARRVGFLSLPIACLVLRNIIQTMEIMDFQLFPWRNLEPNITESLSLDKWLLGDTTYPHLDAFLTGLFSFKLLQQKERLLWLQEANRAMEECEKLLMSPLFQSRFQKVLGLALVSISIGFVIFISLIYIKIKIGMYLYKSANAYLQLQQPDATRRTSVYVPSDAEIRPILPPELDESRLDQVERYTFIKRIV